MNNHVHALVTGASRGIGKSITQKLLESGAKVIGTANRTPFPNEFHDNNRFEGMHVNLISRKKLIEEFKPVFERDHAPNVVVNNAGISQAIDFEKSDEAWLGNWDRTLQINLTAAALISKWAVNRWKKEEEGILINIASRAAYRGDTQEFAAYAASKGGMVALTKTIARDFGAYNIAAYSIAPGFTDTDMAAEVKESYDDEYLTSDLVFDEITSPDEIGELVNFLASGKVKHMTGSTFHINGGSYMI